MKNNLSQDVKVTLLHGQRRIGKSSIIRNIAKSVELEDFVFIAFNLEDYTRENLGKILVDLAQEIIEQLEIDTQKIKPPSIQDLGKEPYIFYSQFLAKVLNELDGKKLVFLLDEFEALSDKYSNSLLENFFIYLHSLIEVEQKLFLVIFAGRQSANIPNLLNSFEDADIHEIDFLDRDSATQLITQPAQGILEYSQEAITAIIELSAGHPYFIQVICFAIFVRARELDESRIGIEDIDNIVDKAIENAEAGLAWFWDGLNVPEKAVFSAVAESQKIAPVIETPFQILDKYGVFKREVIEKALKELVSHKFLDAQGKKIKIELVRRWLLQRHPLRQEIKELEKLNEERNYFEEKKQNNFNYETTLDSIPKKYPLAVLERQRPFSLQEENYSKALEPVRFSIQTQTQKKEISEEAGKDRSISNIEVYSPVKSRLSKGIRYLAAAGVMTIVAALVGTGIGNLSARCLASDNKILGVFCVDNPSINLSSGDRTFFPIKNNTYRDQAIESFQLANYSTAIELFEQARKSDRTDPEVLIYYNNARAKQRENPFLLAVVVPTNNTDFAQEILRGVAQAQQEFNDRNGLNGRLLSVIIANDGDGKEPEKAKQVAAELVKNQSLLGVIGHNFSEATEAALTEYQKEGIPIISPASSTTSLHDNSVFFRTIPSNAAMGDKLAKYAINNLRLTKVVIFKSTSLFSKSMTEEFQKKFQELGGKIIDKVDLTQSTLNAQKEVNLSLDKQAQGAVLITDQQYSNVALDIAKANNNLSNYNQKKGKLKLLSTNPLYSDEILSQGGKAVEGLITVVPWFRDSEKAKKFAQTAKKLWTIDVSWRTASSYDATQAFIQDFSANSNPKTTLASLVNANLSVKQTSGEPLKFSSQREREIEPILLEIKDGKYVAVP
ncbi:MAG: ABC transporter substrate-binding protein [Nostoc sp. CreGUA01]